MVRTDIYILMIEGKNYINLNQILIWSWHIEEFSITMQQHNRMTFEE